MTWDGAITGDAFDWVHTFAMLKPGAHLAAVSSPLMYHRVAAAIEDAGFEIRDQLMWLSAGSHRPIVLARKPFKGPIARHILEHGVGALNIDATRTPHVTVGDGSNLAINPHLRKTINGGNGGHIISTETKRRVVTPHALGRWPTNLLTDGTPEVTAQFPLDNGASVSRYFPALPERYELVSWLDRLITPPGGISAIHI